MGYYDFSDVKFTLPNNVRHGLVSNIHIADVIDGKKIRKGNVENGYYYVSKIDELDFYQEISGFFHSRSKCYVHCGMEKFATENVPSDVPLIFKVSMCAGDYVVDKDFNVYRIYGWDNSRGSEYYWDFLKGNPLTRG